MSTHKTSENEKILDRLLSFFSERKINQAKFIEITGYSSGQASAIFNRKANLSRRLIKTISSSFSISENWLLTGEGVISSTPLHPKDSVPTNEIPVLGRISAGFPNVAEGEVIEYISIPGAPKNTFALVVKGRSMWPTLYDGDYVLFIQNGEYKSEDVLIVLDEWGDAMVKRLKIREGQHFLVSDNPEYPIVEPNENYRAIGKVVKVWRDIKF